MVRRASWRRASVPIVLALSAAAPGCPQVIDLRPGAGGNCLRDVVHDYATPDRDAAPAAGPCPDNAALCETFDDGMIHPERWQIMGSANEITVESPPIPRVGAGSYALHVHTTTGQIGD